MCSPVWALGLEFIDATRPALEGLTHLHWAKLSVLSPHPRVHVYQESECVEIASLQM